MTEKVFMSLPTVAEQQRAIIDGLDRALCRAQDGGLRAVMMITVDPVGQWQVLAAGVSIPEAAGFFMAGATAMTNKMHNS